MAYDAQFALAEQYLPIMDEVYKAASKTSILDAANGRIRFTGGDSVELYKVSLNGLGDYNRSTGYVNGAATGTWEKLTLAKDRARKFLVDRMSNEETLGMAFGTIVGEFIRTQLVPEVDAYRFAKYFAGAGTTANAAITPGTTDVPALIDTATEVMSNHEVPEEGRILFVSEKTYNGLKAKITRYLANEGTVDRNVEYYNGMRVIRVPEGRFYTAITLYDGTTAGQTAGGYVGTTSTGYKLNFMVVHPSAVVNAVKWEAPKIISPDLVQDADAWLFAMRLYHDAFVLANKTYGIYAHRDTTALEERIGGNTYEQRNEKPAPRSR